MADEFFLDERNQPQEGSWHHKRPAQEGGYWFWPQLAPGGSWHGRGPFDPTGAPPRLNRTLYGYMFADADGRIVFCRQNCPTIPPLVAYISSASDVDSRGHGRCILVENSDPRRPVSASSWGGHDGTSSTIAQVWRWPFGQPGSYKIRAKWQKGHYDYESLRSIRFVLYGVSLGVKTLALSNWRTVATVTVNEDYTLIVNGQNAERRGNQKLLEK